MGKSPPASTPEISPPSLASASRYKIAESRKVPVDLSSMRQCLAEGRRATFDDETGAMFDGGSEAVTLPSGYLT